MKKKNQFVLIQCLNYRHFKKRGKGQSSDQRESKNDISFIIHISKLPSTLCHTQKRQGNMKDQQQQKQQLHSLSPLRQQQDEQRHKQQHGKRGAARKTGSDSLEIIKSGASNNYSNSNSNYANNQNAAAAIQNKGQHGSRNKYNSNSNIGGVHNYNNQEEVTPKKGERKKMLFHNDNNNPNRKQFSSQPLQADDRDESDDQEIDYDDINKNRMLRQINAQKFFSQPSVGTTALQEQQQQQHLQQQLQPFQDFQGPKSKAKAKQMPQYGNKVTSKSQRAQQMDDQLQEVLLDQQDGGEDGFLAEDSAHSVSFDPSTILKKMSQGQIVQLLRDPEISKILKESMIQQEREDLNSSNLVCDLEENVEQQQQYYLEEIMPISSGGGEHEARQLDPQDPSIFGNEFEVPQEQTLNTDDFNFTGLLNQPQSHFADKPKLYVNMNNKEGASAGAFAIQNPNNGQRSQQQNQLLDEEQFRQICGLKQQQYESNQNPEHLYTQKNEQYQNQQNQKVFEFGQSSEGDGGSSVGNGHINLENLQEQTSSSSEPSDYNPAFQLFDDEEMNAEMANFIGIHRMQSINSPQSAPVDELDDNNTISDERDDFQANNGGKKGTNQIQNPHKLILNNGNSDKDHQHRAADSKNCIQFPFTIDSDEYDQIFGSGDQNNDDNNEEQQQQQQYMCPVTGAHFHKADLYRRILKLQKRRALIDRAIAEEYKIQEHANKQQQQLQASQKAAAIASQKKQTSLDQMIMAQQTKAGRNNNRNYENRDSSVGGGERKTLEQRGYQTSQQNHSNSSDYNTNSKNSQKLKYPNLTDEDYRGVKKQAKQQQQQQHQQQQCIEEDEQAVILNAGKVKYASQSRPVGAAQPNTNHDIQKIDQDTMLLTTKDQLSKHQRRQSQGQTVDHPITNQKDGAVIINNSQQIVPPHERILQFASLGQFNVDSSCSQSRQPVKTKSFDNRTNSSYFVLNRQSLTKQQQKLRDSSNLQQQQQQHHARIDYKNDKKQMDMMMLNKQQRVDSSEATGNNKNNTKIVSIDMSLPSAYHSHDSRRQPPSIANAINTTMLQKPHHKQQPNSSRTIVELRQQPSQHLNSNQINYMGQQQKHINKNRLSSASGAATQGVTHKTSSQIIRKQSVTKVAAQTLEAGGSKRQTKQKKIESYSFDNRKQLSKGSAHQKDLDYSKKISIDATRANDPNLAYRSMQDTRNLNMNYIVSQQQHQPQVQQSHHPQTSNQILTSTAANQQYWSQGQQAQQKPQVQQHHHQIMNNKQQQNAASNLVGVKNSHIEGGSSRIVSKISVQKAKMRQKQMVSAALHSAKTDQLGSVSGSGPSQTISTLQAATQVIKQESKTKHKNINSLKSSNVTYKSQIEQVEQFYQMLSGSQVVFGRSGGNNHKGDRDGIGATTTAIGAKGSQSMRNGGKNNAKSSTVTNKQQIQGGAAMVGSGIAGGNGATKAIAQGTHARTNTFDNRAAQLLHPQQNTKQLLHQKFNNKALQGPQQQQQQQTSAQIRKTQGQTKQQKMTAQNKKSGTAVAANTVVTLAGGGNTVATPTVNTTVTVTNNNKPSSSSYQKVQQKFNKNRQQQLQLQHHHQSTKSNYSQRLPINSSQYEHLQQQQLQQQQEQQQLITAMMINAQDQQQIAKSYNSVPIKQAQSNKMMIDQQQQQQKYHPNNGGGTVEQQMRLETDLFGYSDEEECGDIGGGLPVESHSYISNNNHHHRNKSQSPKIMNHHHQPSSASQAATLTQTRSNNVQQQQQQYQQLIQQQNFVPTKQQQMSKKHYSAVIQHSLQSNNNNNQAVSSIQQNQKNSKQRRSQKVSSVGGVGTSIATAASGGNLGDSQMHHTTVNKRLSSMQQQLTSQATQQAATQQKITKKGNHRKSNSLGGQQTKAAAAAAHAMMIYMGNQPPHKKQIHLQQQPLQQQQYQQQQQQQVMSNTQAITQNYKLKALRKSQ